MSERRDDVCRENKAEAECLPGMTTSLLHSSTPDTSEGPDMTATCPNACLRMSKMQRTPASPIHIKHHPILILRFAHKLVIHTPNANILIICLFELPNPTVNTVVILRRLQAVPRVLWKCNEPRVVVVRTLGQWSKLPKQTTMISRT
jgi:hypothetical protein